MTDEEYADACASARAAGLDFGKYVRLLLAAGRLADEEALSSLRARLPEVDPHDLHLIWLNLKRRPDERRYFMRARGASHVF